MEKFLFKNVSKKFLIVFAVLILFSSSAFLSSCGKKAEEPKKTVPAKIYWPLTHEIATKKTERPAIAVKIENDPDARPQTGLQEADIVWETMVEGGITRFIAVYHSKLPKNVGPVRSLRLADGPIVAPMKPVIVFTGSNGQRFQQVARDAGVQTIEEDGGSTGFFRIDTKWAPHNDYFNLQDAIKQADKSHKKSPMPQFNYVSDKEKSTALEYGKAFKVMTNTMSSGFISSWKYDKKKNAFLRYQEDVPFETTKSFDSSAKPTQVYATNVIALNIEVSGTPEIDPAGTPEMDMHVVGEGTGYVISDGKKINIKWKKKNEKDLFVFTTTIKDKSGKSKTIPLKLNPGNTWVEFVPVNDNGKTTFS